MNEIASLQNPKIKQVVKLRDRRDRDESDLFLIEGFRELSRAVASNRKMEQLFYCPEFFLGVNENALIDTLSHQGTELFRCAPSVFQKISYRDRPDGLLAVAKQAHLKLSDLETLKKNPLFIVAEAIEKPGNLGTMLRSADGSGADGLILSDRCTDLHNPNVVRSSVGTLFTIPVIETTNQEALRWLKKHNIAIVAATPQAKALYTQVDLTGPIAIVVGTEQLGLSDFWLSQADIQVRIPMLGIADSLNVATATTLLLYEVVRQRG